jgi:hypothetical protein
MTAAAPVRCPTCGRVVFAIVIGMAEGVCCGRRVTAMRERLEKEARIVQVDKPLKRLADTGALV